MAEILTVAAVAAAKESQPAVYPAAVGGYTGNRALKEAQAYRNWYARFDPVTAENLKYENIK